MKAEFEPKYKNFQRDIESYLTSIGKREKLRDGFIRFTGYDAACDLMFQKYMERQSFTPLVSHLRTWNWELSYGEFLLKLTSVLVASADWTNLQSLWDAVFAKRKKLYNDMWKIEREKPGALSTNSLQEAKERLIDTLQKILEFGTQLGNDSGVEKYKEALARVQAGKKA